MEITTLINEKTNWDKSPILIDLLTEYVTSLSAISGLSKDFIIEKLSNQLNTLRFGDFKDSDSNIKYDNMSVTASEFKEKYRMSNNNFGAINIDMGEGKSAICLFDRNNGIDLTNIIDIKHTLYSELTHVLEKSIITNNNIIINKNGSYIVTGNIDSNKSIQEYINDNSEIKISHGLETIEYKQNSPRIMHNQISEGCTELITRMVLEYNGITTPNKERYIENIAMAKLLFKQYGNDAIKTYLTDSNKMINHFLNINIKDTNMLYYADNYISFVNQIKQSIINSNIPNLPIIYANYIKYQSDEISEEELLNGVDENIKVLLKQIIDYKNELNIMLNKFTNNENSTIDNKQYGNTSTFSISIILIVIVLIIILTIILNELA